jgi:hypothetical protein
MASAACMKTAGVPVELKVATSFCAIMALFPMPLTITLPPEAIISFTVSGKSLLRLRERSFTLCASSSSVRFAFARMVSFADTDRFFAVVFRYFLLFSQSAAKVCG